MGQGHRNPADAMARPPALASLAAFVMMSAIGFAFPAASAIGDENGRSGEQVYERTCKACHATGVENAPQFGDRSAWKPLLEEGQDVLTAHAWVGVRAMPARGGDPGLSLAEFSRAVAYMVRHAGGDWRDPDEEMLERIRDEEEKRIESLHERAESHDPADD